MRRRLVRGMCTPKLYAIYSIWKRMLMKHITIGTRASKLAMVQTQMVIERLQRQWPGLEIAIEQIRTTGDRLTDLPLTQIGGDGVFVTEIERALHERRIDLAVHSLKDLPIAQSDELRLVITGPREDVDDVIISKKKTRDGGADLTAHGRGGGKNTQKKPTPRIDPTTSPRTPKIPLLSPVTHFFPNQPHPHTAHLHSPV